MLPTLPMEMIHRVFDELDGRTILFSVRNVCQRLREAVDNYHRYAFDCTSLSTPDSRRVFTLIRPECVIGLSLSDANTSPGQIGMFLSLVGISRFTRLRSMTLLSIQWQDLCLFLRHAKRCSLSSLILHSRSDGSLGANEEKIVQHLSAILSQPSLTRLELLTVDLSNLMKKFQSPIQWKLRYLHMASCKDKQLSKMIAGSPQLEMLELGDETQQSVYYYHQAQEWFSTPCPRLTSLTLKNFILQTDKLQIALSQTPCLRYFKIITSSVEMMDGSRWEQMIKTKLPLLNKFEFYTRSERYRSQGNVESVLNEMIAPFRTSFWRDEKRWRVTCELVSTENRITITIYTSPMCSSQYTDLSELKTKTISNFDSNDQHSTVRLEAVTELRVQLYEILIENQVSRVKHSIERVL